MSAGKPKPVGPRGLRPLLGPLIVLAAVGLWVLAGGLLGDDPWRAQAVVSFKNGSARPARVLALYPGVEGWVAVFHGPTHWTSERGRMQAASADPSLAWIAPGGESAMDLYRPEFVPGCLFVVETRDAAGAVEEAGRVALPFVPGRWVELSLDVTTALKLREGFMSSGFGLAPDVMWGPVEAVTPDLFPEAGDLVPPVLPPLPDA